jgi:hypothetical protein
MSQNEVSVKADVGIIDAKRSSRNQKIHSNDYSERRFHTLTYGM